MKVENVNLTFPMVKYAINETPWDLEPLLYKGGAGCKVKTVKRSINQGEFGKILPSRVSIVESFHNIIIDDLVAGGSRYSAGNKIRALRSFIKWCDLNAEEISFTTISAAFVRWTEHLLFVQRTTPQMSQSSLYDITRLMSTMIDKALNLQASISKSVRIRKPSARVQWQTSATNKQSLQTVQELGHLLADISNTLTWETTVGPLPIKVEFRSGKTYEHWAGLPRPELASSKRKRPARSSQLKAIMSRRLAWENDRTLRTRSTIVNLRIESELLIFIAQTGMNFQQAHTLKVDQFHYTSHMDGYQVRSYKNRRQGEVLFEIFSSYKNWLQRYLDWRNKWFPNENDDQMFPLIRTGGRLKDKATQFPSLRRVCEKLDVKFIGPQILRGTRINWLLRESLHPDQVAEIAQHSAETLLRVYAKPNPQIAMVEISRFHRDSDPFIASPAPGSCVSPDPSTVAHLNSSAPKPDCINTAGCLFCTQHRDIESQDHVWSLSSLRHLKSFELARYRPAEVNNKREYEHPTLLVIDRITSKLKYFEESGGDLRAWVQEANTRISEGDYHPAWDGFIRLAEMNEVNK